MTTYLAADIGGTKCELAVFAMADPGYRPLAAGRYRSRDFAGIEEIIALFQQESGYRPDYASLGVAGVTEKETASVTNLPWNVDAGRLMRTFGFRRVVLLNDLTALCASIALLEGDDLIELQRGEERPGEMIAVIAPGTGLGEGMLLQSEQVFFPQGLRGRPYGFRPGE